MSSGLEALLNLACKTPYVAVMEPKLLFRMVMVRRGIESSPATPHVEGESLSLRPNGGSTAEAVR